MKTNSGKRLILICLLAAGLSYIQAQIPGKHIIKGHLQVAQSGEPVAFATIAARKLTDSAFISGTASDIEGNFNIEIAAGNYQLVITAIGHDKTTRIIDLKEDVNIGNVLLEENVAILEEIVITGERIKARKEADKTTYFMNQNLYEISNTGAEILSYIPGVQVDLMKNISLNGNQNILILVDGRERDKNYLSQLDPSKIDKVEISGSPGSMHDATVTGVINVILRESVSGINGYITAEIPASDKVVYSFPSYSINYRIKKLDVFTSYNGELSFFDIIESENRSFTGNTDYLKIETNQYVRQKDWSHRFHYGAGYRISGEDFLNFYGFYNPYSREFDGRINFLSMTGAGDRQASYIKDDSDKNLSSFWSLFYKHSFNQQGSEITFDINYNRFNAENSTNYKNPEDPEDSSTNYINPVRPYQNSVNMRLDFASPFSDKFKLNAGFKARIQELNDRKSGKFSYDENVLAAYGIITLSLPKYIFRAGLRAEKSKSELAGATGNVSLDILPQASVNLKLSGKQNLELSYGSTIYRPNIYELNPHTTINDPYSLSSGSPDLGCEKRNEFKLEYSKPGEKYFWSAGLFSKARKNAIDQYTFINDAQLFETGIANLGTVHENGIQLAGTLKFSRYLSVNSWLKVFGTGTSGNSIAESYAIPDRKKAALESSLSAIASFRHDISMSLQFQYNTPHIDIQKTSFSDPLWFISLEKTIMKSYKVGITGALPFTRSFTYRGSEITGENFSARSEGNLKLPLIPVWFKLRYQFSSGTKTGKMNNATEDIIDIPKKGF